MSRHIKNSENKEMNREKKKISMIISEFINNLLLHVLSFLTYAHI